MARAEKLWHLRPGDPTATNRLAAAARVSSVVAQLLLNRDVKDPAAARRFLDSPLAGLHPPHALPGAGKRPQSTLPRPSRRPSSPAKLTFV